MRIISLFLVWALVCLGVGLRSFKADSYPVDNNDDGLFYTWAGITFWENPLKPITHSIFDTNNSALIWRSQFMDFIPIERFGMKIVRPWLDHPPLGAALIGLPAKLLGYKGFEPIPQLIVRLPALVASIGTLFLTYVLGKKLFGEKVGRLGLIFLATVPYYVVAHRQSFLENILTPIFLGSLVFLLRFLKTKRKLDLIILMVLAFLSGWIKVPGFAVSFMLAGWLWYKKEIRAFVTILIIGMASILSYIGYGLLVDKQMFIKTLTNQGVRGAFVNSFFDTITNPRFYGEFHDGWYVLGFIFSWWLLTKYRQEKFKFFAFFLASWSLVLFLVAGRFNNSPWYYYPLIPFGAMAIGYYAHQLLKRPSLFLALPFWLLGLTGFDLLKIEINPTYLRLTTIIFFIPFFLKLIRKSSLINKLTFLMTRIFLIGLVLLNIYVSLRYTVVHCTEERCLAPTKIILNYD